MDKSLTVEQEANTPRSKKRNYNRNVKKRPAPKPTKRQNDIYITSKSTFKAQQKQCEDILNSGTKEIFLHCLGSAISRGINLALHLVHNSHNALSYEIHTSTIQLIDELHPLCDDDDVALKHRNNSAVHIKVSRNTMIDVDLTQERQ